MIRIEDLYEATRDGLDIILNYYPQAEECVSGTKKHFKIRDERTPSAALHRSTSGAVPVWKVTDFGGDGVSLSPLDIVMQEEGCRFPEAILKMASLFGVHDYLNKTVNKPEFRKRPAQSNEIDGTTLFSLLPEIPDSALKVLGPKVTREHTDALHWYAAEWVGYVKNREVNEEYSNDNYPILLRECQVDSKKKFYKIYKPLNPEKQWRFSYTPREVKPKDYINGLVELQKAYADLNAQEEAVFFKDPANEGKPFKEVKLDEAFICSGERDSLCVRSMGYHPLWLNSETASISEDQMRTLLKYVKTVYNIPDIDETGIRRGREMALKHLDVHTIWLPEWLKDYRDNRGKPRKDLRDWMELRQKARDFKDLMTLAMPARFWTSKLDKKTGQTRHQIDSACLHYFLRLNGFYTLHDENNQSARYVHVSGFIVESVKPKDIRRFLFRWTTDHFLHRDVINLLLNSPKISDGALENLPEVELDFTNYTAKSQLFFFPNSSVEVSDSGIVEREESNKCDGHYVWSENVIPHNLTLLPEMFSIERTGATDYDIKVNDAASSCFFGYIINSSRLHWRKELETNFMDKPESDRMQYYDTHHFCIDGDGLSDKEIRDQKQNLVNKIFTIGYMLHRYKSPSRAWAPLAMDGIIGEDGECNGRSGKSFLFSSLALFMKTVKLSGRNPKLMDNPHVFDQVSQHTDLVLVDDCNRYLRASLFYDNITNDMTVNPKNNQSFTIPFQISPKFAFTTNYVPEEFDPSSEARLLYMVFSDYYHQKTETNDYLESRSIRDDFGRDLYSVEYSEAQWNADINFFLQCTKFYLSQCDSNVKPLPPMNEIIRRKFKADMGQHFEFWANSYFVEGSDNLDKMIVRMFAYNDYRCYTGAKNTTMRGFTRALKAYCELAPHIRCLNPQEMLNGQGRIIRKDDGGKSADMIYIQSERSARLVETSTAQSEETTPEDPALPF